MNKRAFGIVAASAFAIAALAVPGATLAAGPVFQNPSFEDGNYAPTYSGQDFQRLGNGSTAINGWTVTAGDVDWTGSGLWDAAEGTKSIDLDGSEGTKGAISQTFDTVVNATYVVTFSMSGNPDAAPAIKTMSVSAAGTTDGFTYNTTGNGFRNMNWTTKTFTFVAKSTQTTLTFTSTTGSGWGPAIDNIVITQTLAPGADCKKGGWESKVDKEGTPFRNQGDCVSYYATGEKNLAN